MASDAWAERTLSLLHGGLSALKCSGAACCCRLRRPKLLDLRCHQKPPARMAPLLCRLHTHRSGAATFHPQLRLRYLPNICSPHIHLHRGQLPACLGSCACSLAMHNSLRGLGAGASSSQSSAAQQPIPLAATPSSHHVRSRASYDSHLTTGAPSIGPFSCRLTQPPLSSSGSVCSPAECLTANAALHTSSACTSWHAW